ncbi:hypothetical protein [Thermococcus sp.]|uniref:hypothetical protein n=1 Tax=Thermococcus sp. TaxID=35749 RepID=UPI00260CCD90|nr:hypothetical protein [Thermococcus sp.]
MSTGHSNIRKELFRRIKRVAKEAEDGMRYGVPHLVGEVSLEGNDPKVEVVVAVFEDTRHRFMIVEGGSVKFLFPVDSESPRRTFMELWMFLNGKSEDSRIRPGNTIKGPLYEVLRKKRFEIVWMSSQGSESTGYAQIVAIRDGVRYNMLFEVLGDNLFRVVDVKET